MASCSAATLWVWILLTLSTSKSQTDGSTTTDSDDGDNTFNTVTVPIIVSVCLLVFVLAHIPLFILIWWKCRACTRKRKQNKSLESKALNHGSNSGVPTAQISATELSTNYHSLGQPFHSSTVNPYDEVGTETKPSPQKDAYGAYYILTKEGSSEPTSAEEPEHDYEEPYFEPATEEEGLLQQLKTLSIPVLEEEATVKTLQLLGSGAFGKVFRCVWRHSGTSEQQVEGKEEEVAVKTMEDTTSEDDRVKFLQEAAIMGQFNHPNIIRLLGIIAAEDKPLKIILELMSKGDLRQHLNQIKPRSGEAVKPELAPTLLSYSRQIANGMMYFAVKSFVHRDLAARNILVSQDCVCKIADFGLSRDLQDKDFYKSSGGKIPVKWTAPEALHYHKYSTASDVWSYGCVLYEIWSLGYKPFHFDMNPQVMKKISAGFRLAPPPGCPRAIYSIMIQCWKPEADDRPAFVDIMIPLQKPDFQVLSWSEKDTNSVSTTARTLGSPLEAGHSLYKDLQRVYLMPPEFTPQDCNKDMSTGHDNMKSNTEDEKQQPDDGEYEDDQPEVTARSNEVVKCSPSSVKVENDGEHTNVEYQDDGYEVPPSDSDIDSD